MEILPGNAASGVSPFSSLVLNINVSTRGHRDYGDLNICFVIPIGDFEGAELVMVEPGLEIRAHQGDCIAFQSAKITHLNMHYKGKRASIVLHTDRDMGSWQKDRNGWANNITMKIY